MASITVRNLDETTKARLRVRAARHGRSMEEEARTLLRAAFDDGFGRVLRGDFQFSAEAREVGVELFLRAGVVGLAIDALHFLRVVFQVEEFPVVQR